MAKARAERGVSGGDLMTTVQPAARAAPALRVIIAEGTGEVSLVNLGISDTVKLEKTYSSKG